MVLICSLSALFLLGILLLLNHTGTRLQRKREQERRELATCSVLRWPSCALIVPVGGSDPRIEGALRSLLEQDYPAFTPYFVTETSHEHAAQLIDSLRSRYPQIRHVVAGEATLSGQKNHNLLQGIAAAKGSSPDCYVFCDSTHTAPKDYLQYLLKPIALGETRFTTGYHEVCPEDDGTTGIAYAISVLFMRLLQAVSVFTQPWGGSMAITRRTFEQAGIADLWSRTVVDDCALVTHLQKNSIPVQLVASAVLTTKVRNYTMQTWEKWMERQILFPRFCVPLQWWLLGVLLLVMLIPPFLWLEDLVLMLQRGSMLSLLPLFFFSVYFFLILRLRRFYPGTVTCLRWIASFFLALITFLRVYIGTFGARRILWNQKLYTVGRGGVVLKKEDLQ